MYKVVQHAGYYSSYFVANWDFANGTDIHKQYVSTSSTLFTGPRAIATRR